MRAILNRRTQGCRTIVVGALFAAGLALAPLSEAAAQQPPSGQPSAPGQQPPPSPGAQPQSPQPQPAQPQQDQAATPGLTFEGDAGLILMQVKPDKTNDFEAVMAKLHQALTQTDKPERKQQATGWKIYKSSDPGPGGNVLYIAVIEPVLKGADYTVAKILYEVFPTEVQAIFPIYRDAFAAGLNKVNMTLVQDYGGPAKPGPALPASTGAGATTPPTAGATSGTGSSGATGTSGTEPTPPEPQQPSPR